jgi:UDP-glucose 4-epimerase
VAKILVTGGLGYIGYDLVKNLLKNSDNEVLIYDNMYRKNLGILFHKRLKGKKVKFIEGDILNERKLIEVAQGVDTIYHLAAKANSPYGLDDFHMYDYVNNWGTANVVKAALKCKVSQFFYMSSLSIYGHSSEILSSSSSPNPRSDYAISKLNGERQLKILDGKIDYSIVRSSNTYGFNPSIRLDTVVNNFVYRSIFGQTLIIHGDGQESRGFISVDRLTNQLAQINNEENNNKFYHLCDHCISIMELVEIIKDINPKTEYRHVNPQRKMVDQRFAPMSLPGVKRLSKQVLRENIEYFFNRFNVLGL